MCNLHGCSRQAQKNWVKQQYRYHILLSGTWAFTSTIILQANIATFSNLLHSHRCLEDLLRLLILNHGRVGNHSGLPHHLRLELLLLLRHTSSHRLSCRQNGSHLKPLSHNADCHPRQSSTPTKSDSRENRHTHLKSKLFLARQKSMVLRHISNTKTPYQTCRKV